jgi:hypothetical protein
MVRSSPEENNAQTSTLFIVADWNRARATAGEPQGGCARAVGIAGTFCEQEQCTTGVDTVSGRDRLRGGAQRRSGAVRGGRRNNTDPDFTDAKIDPYTIYTYRVKAVLGPQKTSGPSNEVKAGPPPTGFNVVTLTPKDRELDFGYAMTMVLDSNEDPVFAYTFRDPNNKNKRADNQLFFGGWDRAKYRWREPVQVDVIGDFWSDTVRPIALALDASTGQFGLAYVRSSGAREIAFSSDRGNTWIKQTLPATNGQDAHGCTLAMGGGNIYMATFSNSGPTYISGKASEPAAKWTQT